MKPTEIFFALEIATTSLFAKVTKHFANEDLVGTVIKSVKFIECLEINVATTN